MNIKHQLMYRKTGKGDRACVTYGGWALMTVFSDLDAYGAIWALMTVFSDLDAYGSIRALLTVFSDLDAEPESAAVVIPSEKA